MITDNRKFALGMMLVSACSLAQATVLLTESATTNVDVVDSFFGGTLLDTAITDISNGSYSGTARTAVYDTGSGLDFYYQFSNNATSVNGIERFSAYNFSSLGNGTPINVFQTAAAFGIFQTGTEVADYADRTNLGVIGFSFVPNGASKVNPGTTSFTVIVRTAARAYGAGNFGLLDGIGDNATGFAPTAQVPEPATSSLLLVGLGLLLIARKHQGRQR